MAEISIHLHALAVSGGIFLALWPVSVALRDVSVVDAWWGPGFLACMAAVWWIGGGDDPRSLLLMALVGVWAIRLGGMMVARRVRHGEEDRRYQLIRRAWGASFWWKSLVIVFILQGLLQWLVALGPMSALLAAPAPLGALALAGAALALAGLALETVSDIQLDRFKATAPAGAVCDTGLRAHVRHPNYTGEMMFWWGVWLIAAEVAPWWAFLSPLLLTFLLAKVSGAPMIRDVMKGARPEYEAYAARTPAFVPRMGGG